MKINTFFCDVYFGLKKMFDCEKCFKVKKKPHGWRLGFYFWCHERWGRRDKLKALNNCVCVSHSLSSEWWMLICCKFKNKRKHKPFGSPVNEMKYASVMFQ